MRTIIYTFFFMFLLAGDALATQSHADPEGLYSHQIAHIFFIASMAFLVYQIRKSGQAQEGWRYISLAAILFILWNIDTFSTHIIEEYIPKEFYTTPGGIWTRTIDLSTFKAKAFYAGKVLDHILLVSSTFAFLRGVISFQKEVESEREE